MPKPLWIVVANGSRARLLQRDHPGAALREIMDWTHPSTRQHTANPDSAHRTSGTRGRSGLAQRQSPQAHAREQFARDIGAWLKTSLGPQGVGAVAVFASNPFLGELLSHGHAALDPLLCASHALDLTGLSLPELDQRLREQHGL